MPIRHRPEMIDADWLTARLRDAGALGRARVSAFDSQPIGAGMLGENVRYALTYAGGTAGPPSVVAKFPSADPTSRQFGIDLGLYRTEVRFYQSLAATVAVRVPDCYFADIAERSGEFVLLMEDLSPARVGNQLAGCSVADARAAIVQAAALAGPRFNDPTLLTAPEVRDPNQGHSAIIGMMPQAIAEFHRRYDQVLEPELMAVCDRFAERCAEYFQLEPGVHTLTHHDFRLDNMLFDVKGAAGAVAIVDWQSVACNLPGLDLAYFLGGSLSAAERRAHEGEFLDLYLAELQRHGVRDYSRAELQLHYAVSVLTGVSTPIHASYGTKRTERGDAMYLAMARGACQHALDVHAFAALDRLA